MSKKNTRNANGRSSIYFGKDGYWHGRVTVGVRDDGKPDRRHVMRKDKQAVVQEVTELEKERDGGKVRKIGRTPTVEQWLTHWVEHIAAPSVRPNTLTGYRVAVYNHLIPGIGAHRLDKLSPEHLERLYTVLREKRTRTGEPFKPARIHQVHRTVRTALEQGVRRDLLKSNPAKLAKPPRIPHEEITPFTKEEAAKILRTAETMRNGARFVIALTLGLRKSEALGLQWRDVDFEQRTISIRRSVQRVKWEHGCSPHGSCGRRYAGHCPQKHGGGAKAAELKSTASRRTVGLPGPLVDVLKRHRKEQDEERIETGNLWHDEGWMFTNRNGRPVHPKVDHDAWKDLLQKAGVRDARLHDARHTAATMLLILGVPSRAVMDIMGWSQVSMTSRYQHMTPDLTISIADQVGSVFWDEKPDDDNGPEGTLMPA